MKARRNNFGLRPDRLALARQCQVSRYFVTKVEAELVSCGRVVDPETLKKVKDVPVGPGTRSMNGLGMFIIITVIIILHCTTKSHAAH